MLIDYTTKNAWLRPFKNAGKLLAGRTARGVLSIGYLAFATRALGVEGFGTLTIIYSMIMLLRNILGFQSWQMILRYGAQAIQKKDGSHLIQLVLFAGAVELLAATLGVLLVFFCSPFLLRWFDVSIAVTPMVQFFSFSLFTLLAGDVFLGVFRLLDRHDIISGRLVIEAAIRFIGAGFALWYSPTLWTFILVWFTASIFAQASLIFTGVKVLARQVTLLRKSPDAAVKKVVQKNILKAPEPGLWRYLSGTSVEYSIGAGMVYFIPLLVATVLGPMGVGLYNVAQRFANIIDDLIQKVLLTAIYTDMAWLNAEGNSPQRRRMVIRAGLGAGLIALITVILLAFLGPFLIEAIAGAEFLDAYSTMVVIACATVISSGTFALEPLLMTAGKVKEVIIGRVLSVGTYTILLVPFVHTFGVIGAAFALIVRNGIFSTYAAFISRKFISNQKGENK